MRARDGGSQRDWRTSFGRRCAGCYKRGAAGVLSTGPAPDHIEGLARSLADNETTPDDDDFAEHMAHWAEAERRAASLRGRTDLRTLARGAGERWLACRDRERRALEEAMAHPSLSAERKAAFAAAAGASDAVEEAALDHLAALIALDVNAAREERGRLFERATRGIPPGVRRL